MSETKKNPLLSKSIVARVSGWLLTLLMTAVVTVMLFFLAGVFHSKVPAESAQEITRSAAGLKTEAAKLLKRTRYETAVGTVSPGQVLLTLFDPSHMQLVASVRESLAMHLQPGQMLPTRLDAPDLDCEAMISELVPKAGVASRSFTVKVTSPCPPGADSGMCGRLKLPLADEEVLVVPASASRRVGQLTMVDVVHEDVVHRRNVRIGRTLDADVEILSPD